MEALTIIGILAIIGLLCGIGYAINSHASEKYDYRPFSLLNISIVVFAVCLVFVGLFLVSPDEETPGFSLNTIVLLATAALVYVAHTWNLVRKTSIPLGLSSSLVQLIGSVVLIALAILVYVVRQNMKSKKVVGG